MSAAEPNDFFNKSRSFTEIKEELFGKYFENRSAGCLGKLKEKASDTMLFLDLHAGEEQGAQTISSITNINTFQYLKSIIKRPALNEKLLTFFYHKSKVALEKAAEDLQNHPNYSDLFHRPVLLADAESKAQLTEHLNTGTPSLIFLDPFDSVFASQLLLQAVANCQSDLFMLLRPDNITKAVGSRKVNAAISAFFGEWLQDIGNYSRKEKSKTRRQQFIFDKFISLLNKQEHYTLRFKVNLPGIEEPDYYLLFASPCSRAYRSFKEMLLPYSTWQPDGIPTFIANEFPQSQLALFERVPDYSLPDLTDRILENAATYKYKSVEAIYELDSVNTNYSRENYITVIEQLRRAGKVELLNSKTMQTIRVVTPASVVKYRL
jgi:three-Cys-motif partner protein